MGRAGDGLAQASSSRAPTRCSPRSTSRLKPGVLGDLRQAVAAQGQDHGRRAASWVEPSKKSRRSSRSSHSANTSSVWSTASTVRASASLRQRRQRLEGPPPRRDEHDPVAALAQGGQHARAHDRGLAGAGRTHEGGEGAGLEQVEARLHVAVAAEEPVGVVDVVRLEPLPGTLAAPARGCGTRRRGSCCRIDCSRASISGDGSIPSSLARTVRSWRRERSASPWAPVWYCARTRSSQRRSRSGAARTSVVRQRQHLPGPPAAQHRVDVHLLRLEAQLVEAPCRSAGGRPVGQVGERGTPPQGQRLLQQVGHPVALAHRQQLAGADHLGLELVGVHVVGRHHQDVAVGRRLDRVRPQDLAELDHARLEVLGRGCGGVVAPDRVDQLVGAHRLPQPRGQGLQHDSVVGAETSRAVDGQWTEDLDPHVSRVLGATGIVNGVCTVAVPLQRRMCTGAWATGHLEPIGPGTDSPGDRHEPRQEHRRCLRCRRRTQPRAGCGDVEPPANDIGTSVDKKRPAPKGPTWDHPNRMDFGDGKATLPAKPLEGRQPSRLDFGDDGRG